jgi:tetratricopeptide (TPR) repeat protein
MRGFRAAAAALFVLSMAAPAFAQFALVTGVVRDQAGRPIRGASITAENHDLQLTMRGTTDGKGRFAVLGLRPGEWEFTVQAPGYEPLRVASRVRALQRNDLREVYLTRTFVTSSLGDLNAQEIQQRLDAAEHLQVTGDIDGAIDAYRQLLTRVPALTAIYLQLGALYERKQDTTAALAAYRQLAELEPENAKARAAIERISRQ